MYQRILVPVDGSLTSLQGLDRAIALARLTGGSIRLLHVLDDLAHVTGFETGRTYVRDVQPALRARAHRMLEDARGRAAKAGVAADCELAECLATRVADLVNAEAKRWNADLIVIGTHGRKGMQRLLLGSDAEQVLRGAGVPVLLVRAPEATAAQDPAVAPAAAAASPVSAP